MFTTGIEFSELQDSGPVPGEHAIGMHLSDNQIAAILFSADFRKLMGVSLIECRQEFSLDREEAPGQLLDFLLAQHPWFSNPAIKLLALFPGQGFTLIPEDLYDPFSKDRLLEPLCPVSGNDLVCAEKLNFLPDFALYSLPWNWNFQFRSRFSDYKLLHEDLPWMDHLFKHRASLSGQPWVGVVLNGKRMKIVVVTEGKLQYFNSFSYYTWEDILYFILLSVEQTQLTPAKVVLHLAGKKAGDQQGSALLQRYFSNCKPMLLPCMEQLPSSLKKTQLAELYPLFSLRSCE